MVLFNCLLYSTLCRILSSWKSTRPELRPWQSVWGCVVNIKSLYIHLGRTLFMDNWVLNPLPGGLVQSQRSWTGSTPTGHPLDPSPGDNHHHPLDPRPITWSSSSPKSAPPNHHQNHQHHQQCHHHQNRHLPRSPTTWFLVKWEKSLCTWSIPTLRTNIKNGFQLLDAKGYRVSRKGSFWIARISNDYGCLHSIFRKLCVYDRITEGIQAGTLIISAAIQKVPLFWDSLCTGSPKTVHTFFVCYQPEF